MTKYYVKPTGSDTFSGLSTGQAFKTIAYSCRALGPGDTLYVMPGLYTQEIDMQSSQMNSGNPDNRITITAHDKNDLPLIRWGGSTDKGRQMTFHDIDNITIDNIQFDNYTAGGGVHFYSESRTLRNITVQHCRFINQIPRVGGQVLHAILARCDGPQYPIINFQARNNYMRNCKPYGADRESGNELITLMGNVQSSGILYNVLEDCWGIGLNIHGSFSNGIWRGQPSDCVCIGNYVEISTDPVWTWRTHGSAIYADRALNGIWAENVAVVRRNGVGIAINLEPTGYNNMLDTNGAWVINNVVISDEGLADSQRGYKMVKIGQGGEGEESVDTSLMVNHTTCAHNVVINARTNIYGYNVRHTRVRDARIMNNIVLNRTNNRFLLDTGAHASTADVNTWGADGNLYFAQTPRWEWGQAQVYTSFPAYKSGSGQDANGDYANPQFVDESHSNPQNGNWTLKPGSAGEGQAVSLTRTDGAGSGRNVKVNDPWYFSGPMASIGGFRIVVGGAECIVADVDYTSRIVTVDRDITWSDNDPAHYFFEGLAPSMGLTSTVSTQGNDGDEEIPEDEKPEGYTNIVVNSEFDDGLAPWQRSGSGADYTVSTSGGLLDVNVIDPGQYVQVFQPNLSISEGETYTLEIVGWGDAGAYAGLAVQLLEHNTPYANLGLKQDIPLIVQDVGTPENNKTKIQFTATASSDNARLRLWVTEAGGFTIDSVYLYRGEPGEIPEDEGTSTGTTAAGSDDGEANYVTSGIASTVAQQRVGFYTSDKRDGWHYLTLDAAIPSDAIVDSAIAEVTAYSILNPPIDISAYVELAANAAPPTDWASWTAKTWSSASVDWTISIWNWGELTQFPDLRTLIQELLSVAGQIDAGNKIGLRFAPTNAASDQNVRWQNFEGTAPPMQITINYSTPSGTGTVRAIAQTIATSIATSLSAGEE